MDAGFHSIAEICTALLTGALLLGTGGLSRALSALPDPIHIRVRQAIIPTFRQLLLPMMLVSMAATATLVWQHGLHSATSWSAFALSCTVLLITFVVNVPVNREILTWSPDAPPRGWRWQIARWNLGDELRLVLSLAALLCVEFS